ncbi:MAG: FAD-dependent oxidoreductase, partial [Candidatus Thorarchaeota archaeon]
MYDIAVVGAGPAGSTAARYLAAQGYKVALID